MNHYVQTLKAHLFVLESRVQYTRGYTLNIDFQIETSILLKQINDIREEIKRIEEGE